MKKLGILLSAFALLFVLAACGKDKETAAGEKSDAPDGGEVKVAMSAQPPTLDVQLTTSTDAIDVAINIYETLVAQNSKQQAEPMLAETVEKSDDGLTYTFELRKGVKFHNDKEMTSEDVVASMNRWLEKSSRAMLLLEGAKFEATDEYTVEMKLQKPVTDVLDIMAGRGQFPAIMPSEVVASAKEDGVTENIGTGPYKFVEWKQDQFIRLEKFDQYVAAEGESDGLVGDKTPHLDAIEFHIVTDSSTRLAGIQTGEYDIALNMPFDSYDQLMNTKNLNTYSSFDSGTINVAYNKKTGVMSNEAIRQAINEGVDANSIMLAAVGNEDLYKLDAGYMSPENEDWATDKGNENYNQNDLEKAKKMLKDAGYNNEEVVVYSTKDYDHHYNAAVVLKEQLSQMGVNAKLEIYDWPTLLEKRSNPENWDLLLVGTGYVTTPSQLLVLNPTYSGWTDDEKITSSLEDIRVAETKEDALAQWGDLQEYMWSDYVPHTLFGHYASIITTTDKIEDVEILNTVLLWNVKKNN